jgi:hypothetical protein
VQEALLALLRIIDKDRAAEIEANAPVTDETWRP